MNDSAREKTALFLALLFHVSGAIGILFTPYRQWFIDQTPVNFLLMGALLVYTQKDRNFYFFLFLGLCYVLGMLTEIIGVNTGLLFGQYAYSGVLGWKVLNVPLIIGVNWFIAIFCSCNIIYAMNDWLYRKLSAGGLPPSSWQFAAFVIDVAMLATLFDFMLEPVALELGYWKWLPEGTIPLNNFLSWFVISLVLAVIFRLLPFDRRNHFAVHLLIIQLLFFLLIQTFL